MSRISWDNVGEHFFETGVDRGVVYPFDATSQKFTNGVAWNGLSAVNESPSGAEPNPIFADNIKYLNLMSNEEYGATIECYTVPDEFLECDGFAEIGTGVLIGQQDRKKFGFCYRTLIGNETEGTNLGYKLHLVYNCSAKPSERSHSTTNENPDAVSFSYEIATTPMNVTGKKPTAIVEIDSTKCDATQLAALEDILYGTAGTVPTLPTPDEIIALVGTLAVSVKLSALSIGSLALTPAFDPEKTVYAAATTNDSDVVTATGADSATVTITVNGSSHTSGEAASWETGENIVVITVSKTGSTSRSYTVTVTKSAA